MNEDVYRDIAGIIALLIFASPFIALPIIIVYKVYRKFRPAKEKIRQDII
jgi:hypothetical protein